MKKEGYFTRLLRVSRQTKNKKEKLNQALKDNGIHGTVEYRRERFYPGWYWYDGDRFPQRLGTNFYSANHMIGRIGEWFNYDKK